MTADHVIRSILAAIIFAGWTFYMLVLYKIERRKMRHFLKSIFSATEKGESHVEETARHDTNYRKEQQPVEIGDGQRSTELF